MGHALTRPRSATDQKVQRCDGERVPDAELPHGTNRSFGTVPCQRDFAPDFRSTLKADIRFQRNICSDGPLATFCIAEKQQAFLRSEHDLPVAP